MYTIPPQDQDIGIFYSEPVCLAVDLSSRRDSGSSIDSGFSMGRESDNFMDTMNSGGYVSNMRYGFPVINPKQNPVVSERASVRYQLGSKDVFSYLPPSDVHGTNAQARNTLSSSSPRFRFQLLATEISPKANTERLQIPGKNVIDLERIARGLDTRTTVYSLHCINTPKT